MTGGQLAFALPPLDLPRPVDLPEPVDLPARTPRHPARFTGAILDLLADLVPSGALVLDPFCGTGRVHELVGRCGASTVGVEIEPEWAAMTERTIVGDAACLPFADATFDAVATSPCYGNRLADHHDARDGSVRHSYTHDLGRALHPRSAGALHWGAPYRALHRAAWSEAVRVLRPGGTFLLNVSDHVRRGKVQAVTAWHIDTLVNFGTVVVARHEVHTPRLRYGTNAGARVEHETVAVLVKAGS